MTRTRTSFWGRAVVAAVVLCTGAAYAADLPTQRPDPDSRVVRAWSVWEDLNTSPAHADFVRVVEAADIIDLLGGSSPLVLFAPTDDAFRRWGEGNPDESALLWEAVGRLEAPDPDAAPPADDDRTSLRRWVAAHAAWGEVWTCDVVGESLRRSVGGPTLRLSPGLEPEPARFLVAGEPAGPELDRGATNGVWHSSSVVLATFPPAGELLRHAPSCPTGKDDPHASDAGGHDANPADVRRRGSRRAGGNPEPLPAAGDGTAASASSRVQSVDDAGGSGGRPRPRPSAGPGGAQGGAGIPVPPPPISCGCGAN